MQFPAINQQVREYVLRRHAYTCQACGADADDVGGEDKMCVGFFPRNDSSLTLSDADLKTLCPDCDEGFASATLFSRMSATELLKEIRRAAASDQIAVLDWLLEKFPQRAAKKNKGIKRNK